MKNSKFVIDKLAKLFEQGIVSSKDIANELMVILRSKRDEIVFKMKRCGSGGRLSPTAPTPGRGAHPRARGPSRTRRGKTRGAWGGRAYPTSASPSSRQRRAARTPGPPPRRGTPGEAPSLSSPSGAA